MIPLVRLIFLVILIALLITTNESLTRLECVLLSVYKFNSTQIPNLVGEICTKIFVLQKKQHLQSKPLENSVQMTFSQILNTSNKFANTFYPKHSFPCSISIYDAHVNLEMVGKNWTEFVPGKDEFNVHIFLRNSNFDLSHLTSAVKALPHILFLMETSGSLNTLDPTSDNLVQIAILKKSENHEAKATCSILDINKHLQYKRWNFNGLPFRIALSANFPGPRQVDFNSRRMNEYPRTFNYSRLFKSLVMIIAHYVEEGINGTTTVALFQTPFFGRINPKTGEWEGLLREVMDGNAHSCVGLAASQQGAKVVTQGDAFAYDSISFIIALPHQQSGSSVFFFFESFELLIWLVLIALAAFIIFLLSFVNGKKIRINIQLVFQPVIDQPVDELKQKYFATSNAPCFLMSGWLIAIIVVGNLFKSRLTSVLVEPVVDTPPQTLWELAESDYKIGTWFYKETEFESVIMHMENLTVVQKLKEKFFHYNATAKDECLKNVLHHRQVCMGLKTMMGTYAGELLRNKYGLNLYSFSKDILAARFVIPGISNFVSHIQGRFNYMTETMLENGLIQHWNAVGFRERAQHLRYIEKDGSESYAEAIYPLYILAVGAFSSFGVLCFEFWRKRGFHTFEANSNSVLLDPTSR